MMKNEVTIREVYELVDKKTGDLEKSLGGKIKELTDAFMRLEEGRVSTLEKQMAEVIANFQPVKMVVYGMVALILVTVLGAILYLVVR